MLLGLHTGTIMHTNLMTDIRVAQETGYDAIEFYIPKLVRYLDAGYRVEELRPVLGSLKVAMIDSFLHIERQDPEARRDLRESCERLCQVAQILTTAPGPLASIITCSVLPLFSSMRTK